MEIYEFKQIANNPIAPSWNYFIGRNSIFSYDECKEIKSILLTEEKKILQDTINKIKNDGGTGLGNGSITSRYIHFNVLNWDYKFVEILRSGILKSVNEYLSVYENYCCDEYYIKSWFNVLRKDQSISRHHHADHPDTFLGGHLTICTENTSTFYEHPFTNQSIQIKNKPGDLILFPNWIKHWTDTYQENDVRISIAMDISYKESIHNSPEYLGKDLVNYFVLK